MSKMILIGDIHLGIHQLKMDQYLDITKDYFENFFFTLILKNYKKGDLLIIQGDVFDNRSHLNLKAISYALDIFNWLEENDIDVRIIIGNHDMYQIGSNEHNSLQILKKYKNITIYLEPTLVKLTENKLGLMMPYFSNVDLQKKYLQQYQGKADYIFCHSDLAGAKNNINSAPLLHGPNIGDFVSFPKVYASHIHLHQKIHNFTFIGCPFHLDRNDKDDQKGIYIVDIDSGSETFIPNFRSPEYKSIEILVSEDIDKIERVLNTERVISEKPIDDWYDITINNSLLMEKPELTKKLMDFSRKKTLSQIKQIDDLVIKDTVEDMLLENIGVTLSIPDMVREYVKKQNFKDDIVKDKIINLLEEVIDICTSENNDVEI